MISNHSGLQATRKNDDPHSLLSFDSLLVRFVSVWWSRTLDREANDENQDDDDANAHGDPFEHVGLLTRLSGRVGHTVL